MAATDWQVVAFTVGAAALATCLILPFGLALAWLLARKNWPGKTIVETFVALPLVLPPVATGVILLKLFSRRGPFGQFLEGRLNIEIVFTWKAVVIALAAMSFPLLVRTARVAFEEVNPRLEQVARTLGARAGRVFWSITLPLAFRGVLAGCVLAFARALGEFGATILVAGAIPGKTATLSVSIFNLIQLGQDAAAMRLLLVSVALSFGALWFSEFLIRRKRA
jgi:molybdate transport system permease protein